MRSEPLALPPDAFGGSDSGSGCAARAIASHFHNFS